MKKKLVFRVISCLGDSAYLSTEMPFCTFLLLFPRMRLWFMSRFQACNDIIDLPHLALFLLCQKK